MSLILVRIKPIKDSDVSNHKRVYFGSTMSDEEEIVICLNGMETFVVRNDGKVYRRVRKPELFPPGTSYSETWVNELVG